MYEDAWYSYVPEQNSKKDEPSSLQNKHRPRESLLRQPNGSHQASIISVPTAEKFDSVPRPLGPPEATLVRRAKSYSDFYDAVTGFLAAEAKNGAFAETLDPPEHVDISKDSFEEFEPRLQQSSQDQYQLYLDQLVLSERHLEHLLLDTSGALESLARLSESFQTVESQTTAFQAQCEDLLTEQKRVRDLADSIGSDLQYYGYLEPLTRRLNAPGAGRLVRSSEFLDMLANLNTCIEFMEQHPQYRDSTIYQTRYTSLLERALQIVQNTFATALREVSDEVSKELKSKDQNETTEYILLYGKYEAIIESLGFPIGRILTSGEFTFGEKGGRTSRTAYLHQWQELYKQIIEAFLRSREPVAPLVTKNLRNFATSDPQPDKEFKFFARRCVQYVFDICNNEARLAHKFFHDGPILAEYPEPVPGNYSTILEQNRLSHVKALDSLFAPYLSNGDLHRICDLVNWLETMYMGSVEANEDNDSPQEHRAATRVLLTDHLWPLSDSLFIKAATEIEHFKPTANDLKIVLSPVDGSSKAAEEISETKVLIENEDRSAVSSSVLNAYPTVKTAVSLLIMYNDSMYDRPKKGNVLYEIVHQATESLQRAATTIKRNSNIMDAQVFLIRNLMLIENLFMTHEIPDSIRQSAELDFSPIWDTIRELQARKQLFNPLAYITPLVQGHLLPAVVDHVLDARKELEKVLVQQITAFTRHWKSRIKAKGSGKEESASKAIKELETLLNRVFEDETTRAALWKMIETEDVDY